MKVWTNFTRSLSSGKFDLIALQNDVFLPCASPQILLHVLLALCLQFAMAP
jgi:hypothetical protein